MHQRRIVTPAPDSSRTIRRQSTSAPWFSRSTQFSDRSFAYRPFLGPRRAAIFLRTSLASAAWVVTADIEKFFDNVEHRVVADQLRSVGIDDVGVRLIVKWLLAPAQDRGRWYQPVKGLPQGSPVAPVLANLYLTGFDTALEAEGFAHVRYADDFVVFASDQAEAQRALRYVSTYLASRLRLQVKPAKTQLAPADDGFVFVGFRFTRGTWTIPAGEANLTFDSDTKPSHRRDVDPQHAEPKTEHEPGTWELRTGNDAVL